MSRARIAMVTDAVFPYHRGGKEMRYLEVSRRLADHADVDLYTMRWWDGPRERHVGAVRYVGIAPHRELYVHSRRSIVQALAFAVCCLRLLWRPFDVVEADHMPYLQLFSLRAVTWLRRKRLVVTWHEVWGPAYWRSYLGPFGAVGWLLERLAMTMPDHVIAASPQTADRLRGHLGADASVSVAPNGVDLDRIRSASPATDTRSDLITVGRLLPHKRVDLLIDAVALLRERGRDVTCLIIGDGPGRADVTAQTKRRGVDDLVTVDSTVDDPDRLYALLKSARVFAFPSEREGFGIAVLEALGAGLPVVMTDAPDNLARALIENDPTSTATAAEPAAFADALAAALDRDRSVETGIEWIRSYDWDAVAHHVAKVCLP